MLPQDWISHCIVLHPEPLPDFVAYMQAVRGVFPRIDLSAPNWSALGSAEPKVSGPVRDGAWEWQLLVEVGPMSEEVLGLMAPCDLTPEIEAEIERHRLHALVFLTAAPEGVANAEPMRRLCGLAWPWLGVGASVLAWPDAATAWHRDELYDEVPSMGAADLYFFVGQEVLAGNGEERVWTRTRGLQQFGLPDLACAMPEDYSDADLRSAETFCSSVAPYLVEHGQPLPPGDSIEMGDETWLVVEESESGPVPFSSPRGVQIHRLVRS